MKCFNHHEKDAYGLCKHCQKGLCGECAADIGSGLACKGEHEKDVEFLNSLIENNKKSYSQCFKNSFVSNLSSLAFGLLFIYFGYIKDIEFIFYMGTIFLGYWLFLMIYNFKSLKKITTNYDEKF